MLAAGQKLGPYEILGVLGEGGMGRVYRARDPKLNRDVAIKVLPDAFSADADRVARFTREARALAALSHPNIAAIFGLEDLPASDGLALVMELVPGDDLSVLVARGPMAVADAVPIARQIADALETAHEQGIIHRDLKPANIKVRADGTVKVLDFGLAKAINPASEDPGLQGNASNSPTFTSHGTQMGMILGTAAYMSPEQAKGKSVDRRADIWAFGVVLYEILTGRRAFDGEDVSTTLAAVLMKDPEWALLPADTPRALATLVRRCLERDPRKRLRDIGEARILLSDPEATAGGTSLVPAGATPRESSRVPWLVAAGAVAAAVVFGVLWAGDSGQEPVAGSDRIEASIVLPADSSTPGDFALSPDGRRLVLRLETNGVATLTLREVGDGAFKPLPHTAGGEKPFWSPNGLNVGFFADGKLKIVDLQGGPAQVICDAPTPRGGAWGEGDMIVFTGSFRTGLEKVAATPGSKATVLSTLDESRREKSHRWPAFLPGGTHAVFVAQTGEGGVKDDSSTIDAIDLATGRRTTLVRANSSPLLAPGHLLFWRDGALRAQAFDAARLTVSGDVLTAASGVALDGNERAAASVSASGTLVYQAASLNSRSDLRIVDRTGRTIKTVAESVLIEGGVAVSRDGTRVAAGVTVAGARDTDIWIYDLVRGTSSPLFDEAGDRAPVWSGDDAQVFYENDRKNDGMIYRRFADGRGEPALVASDDAGFRLVGSSRDGQWLVLSTNTAATGLDLVRYEVKTKQITPLVASPFRDTSGALSGDDRWLAYSSAETGRSEIWVRSVTGEPNRRRISSGSGLYPAWRRDGRELYFVTLQGQLMAVSMDPASAVNQAEPRELFRADFQVGALSPFSPLPNGQQFVINVLKDKAAPRLTLVANWKGR